MPIRFHETSSHAGEAISDGNYWFDADGNVTTEEAKGVRWLARTGANVLPEFRDALKAFQGSPQGKVAQPEVEAEVESDKKPKAEGNKKASPSKNKGVKK